MAIVQKEKPDGSYYYKYEEPSDECLYQDVTDLLDIFDLYLDKCRQLTAEDVEVDMVLLAEAFVRIDKRRDYFSIYHEATDMNEIKRSALLAYWLTKFRPFRVTSQDLRVRKKYRQINESFAVFVLYGTIREETERKSGMKFHVSSAYNRRIVYAFKFWDISKEAMMLVAESLCEAMH